MKEVDWGKQRSVIEQRYEDDQKHRRKMAEDLSMRYTVIWHGAREKFGISPNEYTLAAIIDGLSKKDARYSKVPGWCYASKETLGNMLGFSRAGVQKMLNRLIEKKLIERDPDTNYLRATLKWLDETEYYKKKAQR